jgi:uncharacterized protein involved in outer membrane biogenesis
MRILPPPRRAILLILSLPFLVASAVVVTSPTIVNSNTFKTKVSTLLSAALGRGVRVNGDVVLELGRHPTLSITDVSIDNPSDLSSRPMLTVGSFKISGPLFENFTGRYRINLVEANDVTVQIASTSDGRSNWSFSDPHSVEGESTTTPSEGKLISSPSIPHLDQLIVRNLQVNLDSGNPHRRLTAKELVVKSLDDTGKSSIAASLVIDDSPLNISGEVGSINNFLSGSDLGLKVDLTQSNNKVFAEGALKGDGTLGLTVRASGSDFSSLGIPIGVTLPKWTEYQLAFHVIKSAEDRLSLNFSNVAATLSGSTITGSANVQESDRGLYKVAADLALAAQQVKADLQFHSNGAVDATLTTSLSDLSHLSQVALTQLPAIKELSFAGKVHYAPSTSGEATSGKASIRAEDFSLRIGESDLKGTVAVQLSPLEVTAAINSAVLNLAALNDNFAHPDSTVTETPPEEERRIPFELLKELNADIRFTVGRLKTILGLELGATQLALTLKDGILTIPRLYSEAFDGIFTASLSATPNELGLTLQGEHFKGNPVILLAGGTPLLDGDFDFSVDLKSTGDTLPKILETLTGTMSLSSEDAKLKSSSLSAASSGLLELLSPIFGGSKEAHSDCLLVEYDVKNGLARTTKQVFKLGEVFIFGKGTLDLKKNTLRYNFNVNSTNPSFASLIPPFRAFGSLSSPHFVPSASGSVASVFDSTEGVIDSAMGSVVSTANFILARPGERVVGKELCIKALAAEGNRMSSRVGSLLE